MRVLFTATAVLAFDRATVNSSTAFQVLVPSSGSGRTSASVPRRAWSSVGRSSPWAVSSVRYVQQQQRLGGKKIVLKTNSHVSRLVGVCHSIFFFLHLSKKRHALPFVCCEARKIARKICPLLSHAHAIPARPGDVPRRICCQADVHSPLWA